MFADGWTCRACWKPNRAHDLICLRCKTPREADEAEVEARRAAAAARAEQPGVVPDIVVALPLLLAFGGVTDLGLLAFTAGFAAGLLGTGFLAGEVAEGMRDREVWAFVVGVGLSVVAVIGSVLAFQIFAPDLVNPN